MKRNNNEAKDVVEENTRKSPSNFFQTVAIVITIVITVGTTLLIALGYGVAVEAENFFGIPRASLYESVFDLIDLGFIIGVTNTFISVMETVTKVTIFQLYQHGWKPLVIACLGLTLVLLVCYFLILKKSSIKKLKVLDCFKIKDEDIKYKKAFLGAWLVAIAGIIGMPLFAMLLLMVIAIFLYFLVVIPLLIGTHMANIHFNTYVIDAKQCKSGYFSKEKPVQNPDEQSDKSKEYAINCVIVMNDEKKEIGRGYVALSTSKYLLLYNPIKHEAVRVPIGNAKIQTVTNISDY